MCVVSAGALCRVSHCGRNRHVARRCTIESTDQGPMETYCISIHCPQQRPSSSLSQMHKRLVVSRMATTRLRDMHFVEAIVLMDQRGTTRWLLLQANNATLNLFLLLRTWFGTNQRDRNCFIKDIAAFGNVAPSHNKTGMHPRKAVANEAA
jgi:hypothetical protein